MIRIHFLAAFCLLMMFIIPLQAQNEPSYDIITPMNVDRLTQVDMIGRGRIQDIVYAPDGELIALATATGVWLYSSDLTPPPRSLSGTRTGVYAIAFSTDGSRLYVGVDNTLTVYDVEGGTQIEKVEDFGSSGIVDIVLSPSGDRLAVAGGSSDSQARVYETALLSQLIEVDTNGRTSRVLFNDDGAQLLTGDRDGDIEVWDIATGEQVASMRVHTNSVDTMALTSDDNIVVSTSLRGGELAVMDLFNQEILWTTRVSGFLAGYSDMAIYEREDVQPQILAVGSDGESGNLYRYDLETGEQLEMRQIHRHDARLLAVHPTEARILTFGDDNELIEWDTLTPIFHNTLSGHHNHLFYMTLHPGGEQITIGEALDDAYTYDITSGDLLQNWKLGGAINYVAYHPAGDLLAISGVGNNLNEIADVSEIANFSELDDLSHIEQDLASIEGLRSFAWLSLIDHESQMTQYILPEDLALSAAAFLPGDTGLLGLGYVGSTVYHYDRNGTVTTFVSHPNDGNFKNVMLISEANGWLVVADFAEGFYVFDLVRDNHMLGHMGVEDGSPLAFALSEDETMLATSTRDTIISVWDLSNEVPSLLSRFTDDEVEFSAWTTTALAFSPDGNLLALVRGQSLLGFDVRDGELVHAIENAHSDVISDIAFTPDGSRLLTAGGDGVVYVWAVE